MLLLQQAPDPLCRLIRSHRRRQRCHRRRHHLHCYTHHVAAVARQQQLQGSLGLYIFLVQLPLYILLVLLLPPPPMLQTSSLPLLAAEAARLQPLVAKTARLLFGSR